MDELPPHARRLLAAARSLDDPEPERREQAGAALRELLAAHGMVDLPALRAHPAPRAGLRLSLGVKLALGLGAAAMLAAGLWLALHVQQRRLWLVSSCGLAREPGERRAQQHERTCSQ